MNEQLSERGTIDIALDFSEMPSDSDGIYSAERFRDDYLIPLLLKYKVVTVKLDGGCGYGSSFLEEVFLGIHDRLPHHLFDDIPRDNIADRFVIETNDNSLRLEIMEYICR